MSEKNDATEGEPPRAVEMASLDTYSLLAPFVGLLAEKAW